MGVSVTVFSFAEGFWALRRPLCYRFCLCGGVLGLETPSLLPFLLLHSDLVVEIQKGV